MERLYKRLIPVSYGGDFFVFGDGFGCVLYAPLAHTIDAGGLFAAFTPQIRPLGSPMGMLPIQLAFFLPRYMRRDVG